MQEQRTYTPEHVALIDARDVRPALAWSTIARATRLVSLGAARTEDEAVRRALHLLEREHLDGATNGARP